MINNYKLQRVCSFRNIFKYFIWGYSIAATIGRRTYSLCLSGYNYQKSTFEWIAGLSILYSQHFNRSVARCLLYYVDTSLFFEQVQCSALFVLVILRVHKAENFIQRVFEEDAACMKLASRASRLNSIAVLQDQSKFIFHMKTAWFESLKSIIYVHNSVKVIEEMDSFSISVCFCHVSEGILASFRKNRYSKFV